MRTDWLRIGSCTSSEKRIQAESTAGSHPCHRDTWSLVTTLGQPETSTGNRRSDSCPVEGTDTLALTNVQFKQTQ